MSIDPALSFEQLLAAFPPVPTAAWEEALREDLEKLNRAAEQLHWQPPGLTFRLRPFYRTEDLEALPHLASRALLLRRGVEDRPRLRQDIAVPDLERANALARTALEGGAAALGFLIRPADANRPAGVPLRGQDDFRRLLEDIPAAGVPLHFTTPEAPAAVLAMWLNEAERQDLGADALQGALDQDPLAQLCRTGRLPLEASLRETENLLRFAHRSTPALRVLTVDAAPYQEAGGSAVQELAFLLAAASEYLAHFTDRGLPAALVCRHLQLSVPVGALYFVEIAKLRALRLLFTQLVQAYDPAAAETARPYIHAVTSRWNLTRYDAHTNLLRGTTGAAAALVGGCNSLAVRAFDEALRPPGDFSLRLARNTHLILSLESYLDRVADPAGGSYYLEALTDALARDAWGLFQQVEARGGFVAALRDGFIQAEIAAVRQAQKEAVAGGRQVLIGTNKYPDPEECLREKEPLPGAAVPPSASGRRFTAGPDPTLEALRKALHDGALLPELLEKIKKIDAEVEVEALPAGRAAEDLEALRLQTEAYAAAHGHTPSVFLLPLGDPALRSARAHFARNFFGCAGFEILEPPGFDTVSEGIDAVLANRPDIVVICSADAAYPGLAPEVCGALQAEGLDALVVIAGNPKPHAEALRAAGVDGFIHAGADLLESLRSFQQRLGIPAPADQ